MEHHAGLDVSLEETSFCIVDGAGGSAALDHNVAAKATESKTL